MKTDFKSFFLKLVGRSPDQVESQRLFEESLQKVADQGDVLSDILNDLDKINESAKKHRKKMGDLHKTLVPSNGEG